MDVRVVRRTQVFKELTREYAARHALTLAAGVLTRQHLHPVQWTLLSERWW